MMGGRLNGSTLACRICAPAAKVRAINAWAESGGRLAVRKRFQARDHQRAVRLGGSVEKENPITASIVIDGRHLLQDIFDLPGDSAGPRHRRAVGQLHRR